MSTRVNKDKLSGDPQHVTDALWYYEEPKGLMVVHEIRDQSGAYIRTDQITIPWGKIVKSVRRYEEATEVSR